MTAPYIELNIDQGTDFADTITLTSDINNVPINVANYIVTSQLRRSYYSANASANMTCSISDGPNGVISFGLSAANSANIKAGTYVFDVKVNDGTGIISRILEGVIFINPRVTA